MNSFQFTSPCRIVFGRGRFPQVGELAAEAGGSALVIVNGDQSGTGGIVDRLAGLLSNSRVKFSFFRQRGEPRVQDVDNAVERAKVAGCDLVIGLGGGSAIDAAKAVAALMTNGGSAIDYMEVIGAGRKITKPAAPWIAVPTTAGTGAEVTRNAVIACPQKQFKASIRGGHLLARVAVVDPELGVTVPPAVTARAGLDALCQLIESYTSAGASQITDALAMAGIPAAALALPRAFANGADLDAREDMALAALLSGLTLTNAGLGAAHGLAAPLGASFPIPHGTACGRLLPGVMRANVRALREISSNHPVLARYASIGGAMAGRTMPDASRAIDVGIETVAELVKRLGVEGLGAFGMTRGHIPGIVSLASKSSSMRHNPVKLSEGALGEILAQAL